MVYTAAAATAFAGFGFHLYNILKRPGGWSWLNLFYSAPVGAPMALALAGVLGRGAEPRARHPGFGARQCAWTTGWPHARGYHCSRSRRHGRGGRPSAFSRRLSQSGNVEDFASDEHHQAKLYWTDDRIVDGDNPLALGSNNSGQSVSGSTVHFAMVSLRFRPEWFKARSKLGYGADWPLDWREMWTYYDEVENALKISSPVNYPWGPKRPRYPYRPHELNAAALVLAEGAEALGIAWAPTPLATVSAPRGWSPSCVYRGMCVIGCSTNAKQSVLIIWLPRALAAGAEIRDLAMVGRIEHDAHGRATGVHYHREGRWRFQRARNVVVAGYSIETPRLLLNSRSSRFPDGLANSSGLVGKNLMVQSNQAVWGLMDRIKAMAARGEL